jgi:hypothetical protein
MTNPFSLIPVDKSAHFLAGWAIYLSVVLFINPIAAMVAVVVIAASKELVIDAWFNWGEFDKYDALATVLGGVFAAGIYITFKV